jgi:hypothetical protein
VNGFIGHLQAVTTNDYNSNAVFRVHTVWGSQCVTRRFLVTAETVGIPLTLAQVHSSRTPVQN